MSYGGRHPCFAKFYKFWKSPAPSGSFVLKRENLLQLFKTTIMKKLLTAICVFLVVSAAAQMTSDDVNLVQAMYGKNKRDLLEEYMHLGNSSKTHEFWKLCDHYEAERKKLGHDYIKMLQDYAAHYETLSDQKADELVTRASKNNIAFENLYTQYYKKMKPVVGSVKASQFFQFEAYLRSAIKVAILNEIPFIGDIDRSKQPVAKT
jgi:hypothetical protein